MDGNAIGLPVHVAAHLFERIDEGDVALQGFPVQTGDRDAAGGDCGCGEKVAGGGRIGFDVVVSGLQRLRGDVEGGQVGGGGDDSAEVAEHLQGHGDVGLGDEFSGHMECDGFGAGRGGHQQAAEELAADVAVDGRGAATESSGGAVDGDGWAEAGGRFKGDAGAELSEGVDEVADGALAHAFDAIESIVAESECADGREKADAGAAVFEPEVSGGGGNVAGLSDDGAAAFGEILFDGEAQPSEAFDHYASVLAVEHAGEERGAAGKCSKDECAIGDAFGTGWPDRTAEWMLDGSDGD